MNIGGNMIDDGYDFDYRANTLWKMTPDRYKDILSDYNILYDMYVIQGKSLQEIKHEIGCSIMLIVKWLYYFNIPIRGDNNLKERLDKYCFPFSKKWIDLRQYIIEYNTECKCCKCKKSLKNNQIILHHIIPSYVSKYRYDQDNLIILCSKCHDEIHKMGNNNNPFILNDYYNVDLHSYKQSLSI